MRIILVGFGTVGQSLARILYNNLHRIAETCHFKPQITSIVDSQGSCTDENGLDLEAALRTKKTQGTVAKYLGKGKFGSPPKEIISETDADIVIETTPSNFAHGEPGLSNIKTALENGKHVITTNKGPLALALPTLLELANRRRVQLRFSGTVGGGTPFLDFATQCLPGERILGVRGILNGTTNYILTRMEESSIAFERALSEARSNGYPETDASIDLEGFDTAAKLVIIANWVLKRGINLRDVGISGISKITPDRLRRVRESGAAVKLVGRLDGSVASVSLEEVQRNDPICVPGALNALTFTTEYAGEVTLTGPGAGGARTAGSVIRDLASIRGTCLV